MPAVGRDGNRQLRALPRLVPVSQPSSCQRVRSAMAWAVSTPSWRHTRCSSRPSAVTALMASRVAANAAWRAYAKVLVVRLRTLVCAFLVALGQEGAGQFGRSTAIRRLQAETGKIPAFIIPVASG